MKTNKKCNKWKTCAKIKKHCAKTLEMALGNTAAGKSCKKAIGNSNAQKKVNEVCKETCDNDANCFAFEWTQMTKLCEIHVKRAHHAEPSYNMSQCYILKGNTLVFLSN